MIKPALQGGTNQVTAQSATTEPSASSVPIASSNAAPGERGEVMVHLETSKHLMDLMVSGVGALVSVAHLNIW